MSTVEYIDHMGDDLRVVNAARVSFAVWHEALTKKDPGLIRYLAEHNHWTPFAHCQASIRVTAPIFVARQLAKHQVGLVWNEVSRRYVDAPPAFAAIMWRERPDESIKQGSGEPLTGDRKLMMENIYNEAVSVADESYDAMIQLGVAPEQARAVLPQSMMTEWIWTGSLVAFARVCALRMDPNAQAENREVAEQIAAIIAPLFPLSWAALMGES